MRSWALTAALGFEEGCIILSYDGANAFNSIYIPPQVPASAINSGNRFLSGPLRIKPIRTEPSKFLFVLDGGGLEVVESAQEVQQGCNLDPLDYSAPPQDIKIIQG